MNTFNPTLFSREISTLLKGIAITLVLASHCADPFFRYFTPFGGIGVAIFLFFSGYGLTYSFYSSGIQHYWPKRILSVFVPYFILQLITLPLHPYHSFVSFLLDISLILPRMPMGWFLQYLLVWYIVFWVAARLSLSKLTRTYVLGICSFVLLFVSIYTKQHIWFEQSFSFFLGYLACTYNLETFFLPKRIPLAVGIGIVCLGCKQIPCIRALPAITWCLDLFIKISSMWGIISFIKYPGLVYQIPRYIFYALGVISFEIYLIQAYMCGLFQLPIPKGISVILIVLGTLPLAFIFYKVNSWIKKRFITTCQHLNVTYK